MRDAVAADSRATVVVTADDLGLCDAWDNAIIDASIHGMVTSVSLMTTGATYPRARAFLVERNMDHGVHLDLLDRAPLSCRVEVESLVGQDGKFFRDVRTFARRYLSGRVRVCEVSREWKRQLDRALDDGLRPSHLNAHYHLHMFPELVEVIAKLAHGAGIHWIRVPDEPPWHAARLRAGVKASVLWALSAFARRRPLVDAGLVSCRGIVDSGALDRAAWRRIVARLGAGVTEVVCHPGQNLDETNALRSQDLLRWIDDRVRRVSFRDLQRTTATAAQARWAP